MVERGEERGGGEVEPVWAALGDGLLCCDGGNGSGFCHVAPQDDEQLKWVRVYGVWTWVSGARVEGVWTGFWSVERSEGY